MTIEQCLREYAMYTGYGSDGEYDSRPAASLAPPQHSGSPP